MATYPSFPIRIAQIAVAASVMYATVQLALYFGVEEKTWLQRSWETLTGGGIGLISGFVFFFTFGAIGWVCGPLYGAIGIIGLATGGALGGLGLGALVHVIRNPDDYIVNNLTVIGISILGSAIAVWLVLIIGGKPPPNTGTTE